MKPVMIVSTILLGLSAATHAQESAPGGYECKPAYFECRDLSRTRIREWTDWRAEWVRAVDGVQEKINACNHEEARYKWDMEKARDQYEQARGSQQGDASLQDLKALKERAERNLANLKLYREKLSQLFAVVLQALRLDLHQGSDRVSVLLSAERARDLSRASDTERAEQAARVALLQELVEVIGPAPQRQILLDQVMALIHGEKKLEETKLATLSGGTVELLKMAGRPETESMSAESLFNHIYQRASQSVAGLQYQYDQALRAVSSPAEVERLARKYREEAAAYDKKSGECREYERWKREGPGKIQEGDASLGYWNGRLNTGCRNEFCHIPRDEHGRGGRGD